MIQGGWSEETKPASDGLTEHLSWYAPRIQGAASMRLLRIGRQRHRHSRVIGQPLQRLGRVRGPGGPAGPRVGRPIWRRAGLSWVHHLDRRSQPDHGGCRKRDLRQIPRGRCTDSRPSAAGAEFIFTLTTRRKFRRCSGRRRPTFKSQVRPATTANLPWASCSTPSSKLPTPSSE